MPVDRRARRRADRRAASAAARSSCALPPRKCAGIEIAEHQVGVGHGRLACRRGRSRRARAPRRRSPARHAGCRRHRPGAIEPPPAPRLAMSRLFSAMRWPPTPRPLTSAGSPSTIRQMSVLVPPMSNGIRLSLPEQPRGVDGCRRRRRPGRTARAPAASRAGFGDRRDAAMRLDDQDRARDSRPRRAAVPAAPDSATAPGRHRR